jgi:hypothetical protein
VVQSTTQMDRDTSRLRPQVQPKVTGERGARADTKRVRPATPKAGRPLFVPNPTKRVVRGFYLASGPDSNQHRGGAPQEVAGRPVQGPAGQARSRHVPEAAARPPIWPADLAIHRLGRYFAGKEARGHVEAPKAKSEAVRGKTWPAGHSFGRPDDFAPDPCEAPHDRQSQDRWTLQDPALGRLAAQSGRPASYVAGRPRFVAKPPPLHRLTLAIKGGPLPRLQDTLHFIVWL